MGRHKDRTDLGREFGATDVVAERGEEGIAQVRELTGGHGTHTVLECVGHMPAYEQAYGVVRAGGVISRVGVPQYEEAPVGPSTLWRRNITLTGGPGAQRAYIEELLPEVLDGRIEPGKVFDRTVGLDDVPDGYAAMDAREALKVLVQPDRSAAAGSGLRPTRAEGEAVEILPKPPSTKGPAQMFTGDVWFDVARARRPRGCASTRSGSRPARARLALALAGPDPARHRRGGPGPVRGGEVIEIRPGDVIYTPPGEEHWHGAAPDNFMVHTAIWEDDDATWGDHVTDEEYGAR